MDRAVALLERAAHGDLGAPGDGIIEECLDTGEILIVDDLGDAFPPDAPVLAVKVLFDPGLKLLIARTRPYGTDVSWGRILCNARNQRFGRQAISSL